MTQSPGYRPCVGVMLVNDRGLAFAGMRIDNKDSLAWQMPQGGVDKGEELTMAALRELEEETGIRPDMVTILKQLEEPVAYDLPEELIGKIWGGKYRGQMQDWFLMRFHGTDADIDLEAHDPPEFCEWRWVKPDDLPDLIVPFKKQVYCTVLESFRDLI